MLGPGPSAGRSHAAGWLAFAAVVLPWLVLAAALRRRGGATPARGVSEAGALAGIWLVACLGVYAITGVLQPWYVYIPAVGFALGFGAFCAGCLALWRSRRGAPRLVAGAALVLAVAWLGWQGVRSPLFVTDPDYQRASALTRDYLGALADAIDRTPGGRVIEVRRPPRRARPVGPRGSAMPYVLLPRSVAAWADLAYPERSVRVVTTRPVQRRPDELVVVLVPGPAPVARPPVPD